MDGRTIPATTMLVLAIALSQTMAAMPVRAAGDAQPRNLRDTGLYRPGTLEIASDVIAFAPQYPLWSDGSTKQRWISLPEGTSVDAVDPDAWQFPPGTRLWKEFSLGRRIETRYIERRADGSWRFASYAWNEQGTEALLVPERGQRVAGRSGHAPEYAIPSESECRACHDGSSVPVLGFSALQLSQDLRPLAAAGVVRNLPERWLRDAPRLLARDPQERAALGYLHGNCGHCHAAGSDAAIPVDLVLRQPVTGDLPAPGASQRLAMLERMASRDPRFQMPPLGTRLVDEEGLALLWRWVGQTPDQSQGERR